MKYIFFVSFLSINIYAQKVLKNNDISTIVIKDDEIAFYRKTKTNTYNEIQLSMELAQNNQDFEYNFEENDDDDSLREVEDSNQILHKEDIIPIEKNKLLNLIKQKTFSALDKEERFTYFFAHPSFFLEIENDLNKKEFKSYSNKIYGDLKNSPPNECKYYIIDLGQNKFIIYLRGRKKVIICNTKKGLKMFSEKLIFETINKNPINFNNLTELTNSDFIQLNFNENYFVKKNFKNKYVLKDIYDENVLNEEFDSLIRRQYFLIGKINNNYKFFNCYLKELPLHDAKSFDTNNNEIEILQHNKLITYDINGKVLTKKIKMIYPPICATTSFQDIYKIKQDKNKYNNCYFIKVIKSEAGNNSLEKDYVLKNIPVSAKISLRNGEFISMIHELNSNSTNHNFILVNYNNKYGIYDFPTPDFKNEIVKDNFNLSNSIPHTELELKVLLQTKYDNISIQNDRVIFSKDNLLGFYGITNDVEYKVLKQETNNYYRVIDVDNNKGWLSFYEKKVFWDN